LFGQAVTACAFRFLRQSNRTSAPNPEQNSGSAAGGGVVRGAKVTVLGIEICIC
jgi:hypothetical protein